MQYIHYIKVRNFKIFGDEITIDFDDTTVLIGPNNAGKTTLIQAISLWQLGIRAFFDTKTELDAKSGIRKQKGKLDTSFGIGINRQDIEQVPNTDTRQLFNKGRIRTGRDNEKIQISVGLIHKNSIIECTIDFKYFKSEVIYCYIGENLIQDLTLLEAAARLQINLLYPMSGLEREETVLQEGNIRKQIGRGITAGLLRNICYNLYNNAPENWEELVVWMEKLFYIKLANPKRSAYDDLTLEYNYSDKSIATEKPLDILQAGRGQLQMLLILAFVLWRRNSIVLIDEPDAHLEVLRQSQVMEVLKTLVEKYNNQIIIATHSEVIMNETENLTFLLNGKRIDLDESKKKVLKNSLKDFGIEHYYKAELTKFVLYLEGTTDKMNLKTIAEHTAHPAAQYLSDKIFVYYTQSPDTKNDEFEMQSGYYTSHKKHFQALAPIVNDLKGMAIFDNDNKNKQDEETPDFKIRFWKQYELENYFITPKSLMLFIEKYFTKTDTLIRLKEFEDLFESHFLLPIFDNNPILLDLYKKSSADEQNALYNANCRNKKVSLLTENLFNRFALNKHELILRKGEFYKIIEYCKLEDISIDVKNMLDELYRLSH
jgi:ABC-type cobalamin/Fe3+-siderophores transport system ATPase subunit